MLKRTAPTLAIDPDSAAMPTATAMRGAAAAARDLAWVGRHTLHELHHHTADIDRSLANPF